MVLGGNGGHHAEGAVEHPSGTLVVVVTQLGDLVAGPEHPPAMTAFRLPVPEGGQFLLQQEVEVARARRAAAHRCEHLDVAPRIQAELGRDAAGGHIDGERGGLLGVLTREEEEIRIAAQPGELPGVDPVGVDDDAGLLRLTEDPGQPHPRNGGGRQQVPQHLASPDRGKLVHVADQQQVRTRRDRLDQLVSQDQIHHRALVDHHEVRIQRAIPVVGGIPARPQLQQPVHGGRRMAGQLTQPLGRPARRRDQDHLGVPGGGQLHHRPDRETLPAARPAGEHGHRAGERQPYRLLLLLGQRHTGSLPQPAQRLVPVQAGEGRQPVLRCSQQLQERRSQRAFRTVKRHQVDRGYDTLRVNGVAAGARWYALPDHFPSRG